MQQLLCRVALAQNSLSDRLSADGTQKVKEESSDAEEEAKGRQRKVEGKKGRCVKNETKEGVGERGIHNC